MSIAAAVNEWFRAHGRDLPWREADFSPWGILVSEFMLQQTPVARVIEPLAAWLERWLPSLPRQAQRTFHAPPFGPDAGSRSPLP